MVILLGDRQVIICAGNPGSGRDEYIQKMLTSLTHELEKVRPAEKRLIIKLAETIREHDQFLKTLGYGGDGENK